MQTTFKNKSSSIILTAGLGTLLLLASCSKDDAPIDTTYPTIDVTAPGAFPRQCSELHRGERFTAHILAGDNKELGSVSIDIHHNFDQHSHSTEVSACTPDAVKTPVKPYVLIKTFPLPAAQTQYTLQQELEVPADIDPGDYHFLIRVTDKAGWQTIKGLSVKIK